MNETDLLLVNRSGRDYALPATEIEDLTNDTDLLVVNRAGVDYKVSGKDLKGYLYSSLDLGLDPDGNALDKDILVVFECLTDDVAFVHGQSNGAEYKMATWINNLSMVPMFPVDLSLNIGDIVKIRVRPSDFMYNSSWEMDSVVWTPLQLATGKIRILPETDITYLTDDSIKEYTQNQSGWRQQPACLFGMQDTPSVQSILNLENIRLGPNLSNNNRQFYILGYRNAGNTSEHDLSECRNPHAPVTKPSFPGITSNDLYTSASYGLICNSDWSPGTNVIIPDWDTYRGA